jgi:DNA-directed RNA polymerase specialized sigma24 family protein
MSPMQWDGFYAGLDTKQRQLVILKQEKLSDEQIATELGCTVKQVQKRWTKLLDRAWEARNA